MQFKYATPSSARAAIVLPAHSTPGSLGRRRNRALPDSGVAFTLPAVPAGNQSDRNCRSQQFFRQTTFSEADPPADRTPCPTARRARLTRGGYAWAPPRYGPHFLPASAAARVTRGHAPISARHDNGETLS
ncbi:hypothetical protein G6F57_020210 [Rhizopus arrhizus]|nr:hypothetical protein G6F57_020210 [Rhizopus arrhizus]